MVVSNDSYDTDMR